MVVTNSQHRLKKSYFAVPRYNFLLLLIHGKHCLTYLRPVIKSELDKSIRSSETLDTFNKRIKMVNFKSSVKLECSLSLGKSMGGRHR